MEIALFTMTPWKINIYITRLGLMILLILSSFELWSMDATKNSSAILAADNSEAISSEAMVYFQEMYSAQLDFYKEHQRFSSDFKELKAGLNAETKNYRYKIGTIDKKDAIQITGLAKRDKLKSYVSLVYVARFSSVASDEGVIRYTVCESDRFTRSSPQNIRLINNVAKCPPVYSDLEVMGFARPLKVIKHK